MICDLIWPRFSLRLLQYHSLEKNIRFTSKEMEIRSVFAFFVLFCFSCLRNVLHFNAARSRAFRLKYSTTKKNQKSLNLKTKESGNWDTSYHRSLIRHLQMVDRHAVAVAPFIIISIIRLRFFIYLFIYIFADYVSVLFFWLTLISSAATASADNRPSNFKKTQNQ